MKNNILKFTGLLLVGISFVISSFNLIDERNKVDFPKNKSLKILIISDLNAGYGAVTYSPDVANTIAKIDSIKPDLILCGGDMVAGQKATLTTENIDAMWQNFDNVVLTPISKLNIPFGFTLGNHDASPNFLKDRSSAQKFWTKRIKSTNLNFVDSSNFPFYFSYVKNDVFIISCDATAAKIKPEVFAWMQQQLNEKVAKQASLRIVLGHLPLYAIVEAKNKPGEVNSNPDSTLAFFEMNNVNLYISGHQHAYFPAHKKGVQLLNLGCIGDGPRPLLGSQQVAIKAFTIMEVPKTDALNFSYSSWSPTTNQEIKNADLPESVTGFNGTIKRKDQLYLVK